MVSKDILVKKRNGRLEKLDIEKINKCVQRVCGDIEGVSANEIINDAHLKLYDKIKTTEIDRALIMSAAEKIEKEPNYSRAAAQLFINTLYKEVFGEGVDSDVLDMQYRKAFISNIKKLVKEGRINPLLLGNFDLKKLMQALAIDRDKTWDFRSIKILYDRYLLHLNKRRMETPQAFLMRVAMGLSIHEDDPTERAIEFYEILSQKRGLAGTPTLFNSGTTHSQLSSCYLSTIDDSIDGIYGTLHGQARLSKYAGGLGVDWTYIRSTGSYIHGTNGESQGVIPFMKGFDSLLVAVNQGGKRKGAGCSYLETWHIDIEDFLNLRKNTGDDRRRTHDMHTANWIPDLFMNRVKEDGDWYLFSPYDSPDLHDLYGQAFDDRYVYYCKMADEGKIKHRKLKARDLFKKMLRAIFETGHPWMTWKDPANIRSPQQHCGVVHSSNLCTEITLNTKPSKYHRGLMVEVGETAVCNLSSVNIAAHVSNGKVDWDMLSTTVSTMMRMLDNVIDINYYPTREAENSNKKHRPVGLGLMGFHSALYMMDVEYDSDEAVGFSDELQEFISYHAILSSSKLAKERGTYETYKGSLWDQNKLPIDTYRDLMKYRNKKIPKKETQGKQNWDVVRKHIKEYGMRNSNTMAIAPTATISYICGVSQSIEPDFALLYTYQNLSGDLVMVNEHFVRDMKEQNLWCQELADALKVVDGDISKLKNIPENIQNKYKIAFNIPQKRLIDCAAARQKWIDQGQSLNLYLSVPDGKKLQKMYMYAWESGLKTTYYLRSKSSSNIEKSTVTDKESYKEEDDAKACSLEAMMNGDICESCQ